MLYKDILQNSKNSSYFITPEYFGYDIKTDISINKYLQECFNYCRDNECSTVFIRKGVHKANGRMNIYKNTRLILEEGAVIQCIGLTGTPLINGDPDDNFVEYDGNGNIYIEGGTWISNSVGEPESNRNLFGFGHADGITIKNVTFMNIKESHCIDLNSSKNVLIENCKFLGFKDNDEGTRYFSEAIQIAEHTQIGFGGFGSYDATPCKNVTIRNCYFGASDIYGPFGSGVGNHGAIHDIYQENIVVDNCVFEGMLLAGVRPMKWNNVTVKDSTFKNCKIGVVVSSVLGGSPLSFDKNGEQTNLCQAGKGYSIYNNTFVDCKDQAIRFGGQTNENNIAFINDIIISDNKIEYSDPALNTTSCIFMLQVSNYKIKGNIMNNSARGLWLKYANNGEISDNLINNALYEGMYINEDGTGDHTSILNNNYYNNTILINNNKIINVGRTGILLNNIDNFTVSSNRIKNSCFETLNTRNGISVYAKCKNGEVFDNTVEKVDNQRNKYGIDISTTCSNISAYDNLCYGVTSGVNYVQVALKDNITPNSVKWNICPLNEGITSYDEYSAPEYTINKNSMVTIRGAVTHDKSYRGVLFTLPEGYRPKKPTFFLTPASNANIDFTNDVRMNRIYIATNGEVKLEGTNSVSETPFTTLDINFYTL